MSEDPVKKSIDDLKEYALISTTEMWREAERLAIDPKLSPEHREFYGQKVKEFHAEMVKLGHKHGRTLRTSTN